MTIELTFEEFFIEQFQGAKVEKLQWDTSDKLDITRKFNPCISQGWMRSTQLRDGILLFIDRHRPTDQLKITRSEIECNQIQFLFTLSGRGQGRIPSTLSETIRPYLPGKYSIRSTGLYSQEIGEYSDTEPISIVRIHIHPSVFRSFSASSEEELPSNLRHLIKSNSQEVYLRSRDTTPMMTSTIQQILRCSYQGFVKRTYLEGKVIELLALVLDHEILIQQGEEKKEILKPEQKERIYYAKEILLKDLSNPPSITELARQVGLNTRLLKSGFRTVFGITVFGALKSHRLEIAKQLLVEQDTSVSEVAALIGYSSIAAFSRAFKSQFGINPKEYQKACR